MMKHKVQVTFTQDEYDHLLALKNYFGFKSLSETVSFAVEKEIKVHEGNKIYNYYLKYAKENVRSKHQEQASGEKSLEEQIKKLNREYHEDEGKRKIGLAMEQGKELERQLKEDQKLFEKGLGTY
jgi:hypothetical protein